MSLSSTFRKSLPQNGIVPSPFTQLYVPIPVTLELFNFDLCTPKDTLMNLG
jgi:hypothetical protein